MNILLRRTAEQDFGNATQLAIQMIVNKAPTVKARARAPIQNSPGTH